MYLRIFFLSFVLMASSFSANASYVEIAQAVIKGVQKQNEQNSAYETKNALKEINGKLDSVIALQTITLDAIRNLRAQRRADLTDAFIIHRINTLASKRMAFTVIADLSTEVNGRVKLPDNIPTYNYEKRLNSLIEDVEDQAAALAKYGTMSAVFVYANVVTLDSMYRLADIPVRHRKKFIALYKPLFTAYYDEVILDTLAMRQAKLDKIEKEANQYIYRTIAGTDVGGGETPPIISGDIVNGFTVSGPNSDYYLSRLREYESKYLQKKAEIARIDSELLPIAKQMKSYKPY